MLESLVAVATGMVLGAQPWTVDDQADEGPAITVSELVASVGVESGGRVPVSLGRHAQMYFLYRADEGFEDHLRLLKEALSSDRAVRCTFREYSGRIVAVEWAATDWRGIAIITTMFLGMP